MLAAINANAVEPQPFRPSSPLPAVWGLFWAVLLLRALDHGDHGGSSGGGGGGGGGGGSFGVVGGTLEELMRDAAHALPATQGTPAPPLMASPPTMNATAATAPAPVAAALAATQIRDAAASVAEAGAGMLYGAGTRLALGLTSPVVPASAS